jgi:hemerythrin superfamily protein
MPGSAKTWIKLFIQNGGGDMFDWLYGEASSEDAVEILKRDHETVKDLFDQYEKAEKRPLKTKLAAQILHTLQVHADIEEQIFYPAVRRKLEKDMMNEADEEHHVAKLLIAELEGMSGRESHYDAKMTVLAENVRHHIKEEESEMLPKARALKLDMVKLGKKLLARKQLLHKRGVPEVAEAVMVAASQGHGDSSARAAEKKRTPARKRT